MDAFAYLALYLDAPMQSWGYQSRYDRRTTLSYPTRSGIVGMICAAMGVDRSDTAGLARFGALNMTVYTLASGMRATDFHTVGGGYDLKTERQHMSRKADGGTPQTVVTNREYLCSAKFGVVIEGEGEFLGEIADALANPRWGVWLGRKSCVPASPVCQGVFTSIEDAEAHLETLSGLKVERFMEESASLEGDGEFLMDVPVDFARREYTPRFVVTAFPARGDDSGE